MFVLLFHIAWTTFVAFLTAGFLIRDGLTGRVFIGLLVTLFGIGCFVYEAGFKPRQRANTTYGLTDRRALTLVTGHWPKTESVYLWAVGTVRLQQNRDGTGNLVFADFEMRYGDDATYIPSFRDIPDAWVVRDLIEANRSVWEDIGADDYARGPGVPQKKDTSYFQT